jgi:energy-coupling factor transporter ATP-binding protein EcfA2
LLFPSFKARYESIKSAFASTFDWIFEDTTSTLRKWLKEGDGIYWVQGKAGSGKSTLLRYLSGHPNTSAALESWAGTYQLFIGRHFFWNAGSSMQKSQAGLLQTLLYQVLRKCPDLVESVCPAQWSDLSLLCFVSSGPLEYFVMCSLTFFQKHDQNTSIEWQDKYPSGSATVFRYQIKYSSDRNSLRRILITFTRSVECTQLKFNNIFFRVQPTKAGFIIIRVKRTCRGANKATYEEKDKDERL